MPTQIITKRGLKLSVEEAELQCSLEVRDNSDSLEDQRFIALKLAEIYEHGTDDVNKNLRKANRYLSQATNANYAAPGFWSSDTLYALLDAYNSTRVMLIRTNRFLVTFEFIAKAFLTRMFSIAGLYFFGQLAYSCFEIAKEAYNAMQPLTEPMSLPKRILNRLTTFCHHVAIAFNSDPNRTSRMRNDILWGSINLTVFLISTPFAVAINLTAFATDLANAAFRHFGIQEKHNTLLEKMDTHLHQDEDNQRGLNNAIKALLSYERQLQERIQQYKKMGISISLDYAKKLSLELVDIQSQKKRKIDELVTCVQTKNQLQHDKSKLIESKTSAAKQKSVGLTSGLLVLTAVALASIPGVNLIAAAAGVCTLMAISVYWFQRNALGFINRASDSARNAENERRHAEFVESFPADKNNVLSKRSDAYVSTQLSLRAANRTTDNKTVKAEMRKNTKNNIALLERTLRLHTELKSVSSTISCLSKEEISQLQHIFKDTNTPWGKHMEYWMKNPAPSSNSQPFINEPSTNDCSFAEALQARLTKERADKLALDSSVSTDGRVTLFSVKPAKEEHQASKTRKPSTYGTKALGM